MCCGATSYTDWMNEFTVTYPESCKCEWNSEGCTTVGIFNLFDLGCYTKMQPHTIKIVDVLGGLAFTVAVMEVQNANFIFLFED